MERDDMKDDDIIIPNVPEIKAISPLSSSRDQVINTTSEGRATSSSNSSGSSPSDLKRRLQGLPSPSEYALLTDHVTALGRQICRKREIFFRLHASAADRIDENDEWEESEQSGSESSLRAFRPKNARARRRARLHPETWSSDDKAMVISHSGDPAGPPKLIDDDDSRNPADSIVNRLTRDSDYLRLPTIEIARRQPGGSSLSEPSSTRCQPHHYNDDSRDAKSDIFSRSHRNFALRDRSADLRTVSPFALSNVRSRKFGGYRTPAGVVLKNLSSDSDAESINANASREQSSFVREIDDSIATLELPSPESKVATISEPIKEILMSARSDITHPILPNLLSTRSLRDDDPSRRTCRNTARSYVEDSRINHNGSVKKICNTSEKMSSDVFARASTYNQQMSRDGHIIAACKDRDELSMKICNELRQVEPEYKNTRNQKDNVSQSASTFATGNFVSESTMLVTSICNEGTLTSHGEPIAKANREFKHVESKSKDKCDEKEGIENYRLIYPKTFEIHRENANKDILDTADRWTTVSTRRAIYSPHLTEGIPRDTTEEASSPQTSEPFGSEDHSRSSRTPKTYSRRGALVREEMFPHEKFHDTSDERDQEITATNVPTLALNSRDISCTTSGGSREYSATRPLDPHALIEALSDVSLRLGPGEKNASRKRGDVPRRGEPADVSNEASDFPAIGETWRVERSLTAESAGRALSRDLPSWIPIRISSSKTALSCGNASRFSVYRDEHSENSDSTTANYRAAIVIDRNNIRSEVSENTVRRRAEVNLPYSQSCERGSSLKLRSDGVVVTVVAAHADASAPKDEAAGYETNDYEPGSLTSSNLPSPRSTSCGDRDTYRKTHASENKVSGKNRSFHDETVYYDDQYYSKIDDDVRSRSDHSTSRKSANSVDVTSVNGSPYSPRKKNEPIEEQSSWLERSRNVKGNVAECEMEDECALMDDEGNVENMNDENYYTLYNDKSEAALLQTKEHFKLATKEAYHSFLPKTRPLQIGASPEIEKIAKKRRDDDELHMDKSNFDRYSEVTKVAQSDSLMFQTRKMHEISNFHPRPSSSALNLSCEAKRKKKSQERFPFTISETRPLPIKCKDMIDCQSADKRSLRTKTDDHAEEKIARQLKVHPSITRLADAGMEDTVAEILCCAVQDQKENKSSSRSRMKVLVQMLSAKLKRAPKQRNNVEIPETTEIIYKNRACQADSRTNSCSDGSSTESIHDTKRDESLNTYITHSIAGSNPGLDSEENILKKTESLEAIPQEHPCRRYRQDDLWVQNLEKFSLKMENNSETSRKPEQTSPPKDRYSIFLAKNLQSIESTKSKIENSNSMKQQHNALITDHMISSIEKNKKDEKVKANLVSEEIEEDLTGCICSGLCRLITPSKYRLSIRGQVPSSKMKTSGSLLRKKRK